MTSENISISEISSFIGEFENYTIDSEEFCTFLIYRTSTTDSVTPEVIADEFDISEGVAQRLLDWIVDFGLGSYQDPASNVVIINQTELKQFYTFVRWYIESTTLQQRTLFAEGKEAEVDFTYAVPPDFDLYHSDLMASLSELVETADSNLLLVTPFLTQFGVDQITTRLAKATKRGVDVQLLTRDTADGADNSELVEELIDVIKQGGDTTQLEIFDYGTADGRLHAKALIADQSRAYVGSANMTRYSLQEAIEIGVIIEGNVVNKMDEFFQSVCKSSGTEKIY